MKQNNNIKEFSLPATKTYEEAILNKSYGIGPGIDKQLDGVKSPERDTNIYRNLAYDKGGISNLWEKKNEPTES